MNAWKTKNFICPVCRKSFRHEGHWKRHVEKMHPQIEEERQEAEPVHETFDPSPLMERENHKTGIKTAILNHQGLVDIYGERAVAVVKSNICPRDPESAELPAADVFEEILSAVEREKGVKFRK